jgi:hypothetical protein
MIEYCVCGHLRLGHKGWEHEPTGCTESVIPFTGRFCSCQEFKLDNLKLIEHLAKERNLI